MTAPVRRLARWVSGFCVRHASAGSREWAEGLARECEFVESDWRALGWAAGSLRVLVDRREAAIRSVAEIPGAAARLWWSTMRDSRNRCIFFFAMAANYGSKMLTAAKPAERLGCAGVLIASIYLAVGELMEWRRQRSLVAEWGLPFGPAAQPEQHDATERLLDEGACAMYYRAELERLVDYWGEIRGKMQGVATMLMVVGMMFGEKGGPWAHPVYAVVLGGVWMMMITLVGPMARRHARRYQRQLDELDGVLGSRA